MSTSAAPPGPSTCATWASSRQAILMLAWTNNLTGSVMAKRRRYHPQPLAERHEIRAASLAAFARCVPTLAQIWSTSQTMSGLLFPR